jgi:hypothetical protein
MNETTGRRPVRIGAIIWGCILLLIATLAVISTYVAPAAYTPAFVIWSVIGFGGLLVIAGLVGVIVRVFTRGAATPAPLSSTAQPVQSQAPAQPAAPAPEFDIFAAAARSDTAPTVPLPGREDQPTG